MCVKWMWCKTHCTWNIIYVLNSMLALLIRAFSKTVFFTLSQSDCYCFAFAIGIYVRFDLWVKYNEMWNIIWSKFRRSSYWEKENRINNSNISNNLSKQTANSMRFVLIWQICYTCIGWKFLESRQSSKLKNWTLNE